MGRATPSQFDDRGRGAPPTAGIMPLYSPRTPIFGALAAMPRIVAPGVLCTRVFSVSMGCSASTEAEDARPPASAALARTTM